MPRSVQAGAVHDADVKELHSLGYAQELSRRMSGFSNFAISFAIICIVAGGITAFGTGLSAAGGASIGIGWPIGACSRSSWRWRWRQIASAYPTAGGLYHWSSILGGRGWGWATAWFNLLGLIFVVASVDVGLFFLLNGLILTPLFGIDLTQIGNLELFGAPFNIPQFIIVTLIVVTQALFNHFGIRVTTLLTDFSGYLIFATAIILTIALLAFAPSLDFSRLFTFTNYTGDPGARRMAADRQHVQGVPAGPAAGVLHDHRLRRLGAHLGRNARRGADRAARDDAGGVLVGPVRLYHGLRVRAGDAERRGRRGAGLECVLLAARGFGMPSFLRVLLSIGIVVSNYLCALAGLTSLSRMTYAFARDGGLPFSNALKTVSAVYRTPVVAIWVGAALR